MQTVLAFVFALLAAPALASGLAIVINSGDASLSVLDAATGAELRRIPVLREPHHAAISPDGKELLIGDAGGNEMLFLDPKTGDVRRRVRPRERDPKEVAERPAREFRVVGDHDGGHGRPGVAVFEVAADGKRSGSGTTGGGMGTEMLTPK